MSKPEQTVQIQIANYLKLKYPKLLWTISPVGLIISRNMGILAVRMGYQKGTPDIMIFEPRYGFHGLFLELKVEGGTVSDEQTNFLKTATTKGYVSIVCWGYQDAVAVIERYLT